MNFCAKCGRERPGDARYCGGCGTEFEADSAAAATPSADDSGGDPQRPATVDAPVVAGTPAEPEPPDPPAEPAQWDIPATAAGDWAPVSDATRVERQPDATMIDRPGRAGSARAATPAEPDPFAAWFAPDAQAAPPTQQRQAAEPWQAADTVYAGPGQQSSGYPPQGYPPQAYPPSQAAPGYPPPRPPYTAQPGPPSGGKPSSGGRKTAWIVLVVLVMLAAGGGAYALVSRSDKHNTAQPTITPTTASSAASSAPASTGPSTSPTSASPSASASASASPSLSLVTVGAGVGSNTAAPAVETTLSQYFQGINTHNYTEYQNAHTAAVQATEPESAFNSGYGSTKDSGMTLVSLDNGASDTEEATVTFVSRQDPSASIDGSACNQWKVTYFLVPHGHGYLIGSSPADYKPSYTDC